MIESLAELCGQDRPGGGVSVTILVSEGAMVRVLENGNFWRNHIRVLLIDIQRKSKR